MPATPWTKQQSSFASDRIRPTYSQPQPTGGKGKGKGKSPQPQGPPKSPAVITLEALISELEKQASANEKIARDPKGGCFCLAREHSISPYVPLCLTCGLILCNLNLPTFACSYCATPLLLQPPNARQTVLTKLRAEIDNIEWKEEEKREEARKAAGAFPALGPSPNTSSLSLSLANTPSHSNSPSPQLVQDNRVHKVVSLGTSTGKGGKKGKRGPTIITSYTPKPPKPDPTLVGEDDEKVMRVPRPSAPAIAPASSLDPSRPWKNLLGGDVKYIPEKGKNRQQQQNEGNGQSRGGKKKIENEARRTVPGAS